MEVTAMHLAHLLSALCAGLACPDLWSPKTGWTHKPDKLLNSSTKSKCPKVITIFYFIASKKNIVYGRKN